jgi:hypothetical protein
MNTHEHWLVRAPQADIADGMRVLHSGYAQAFNRRHARRGVLYERHFGARCIRDEAHLRVAIRYLALNPRPARATTYHWSTYPQLIGIHEP